MAMKKYQTRLTVELLEARDLLAPLAGGYTPAQIRHAYGYDQIPWDGNGETIAIVDAYDDPWIGRDLQRFDQAFGLPDPLNFTKVDQNGGTHFSWNTSWSGEISMDVEWAHAIAPRANILLVEAYTPDNLDAAVDYARHQPGVVAVSMSYGSYEDGVVNDALYTTPPGHIGGYGLPGGITFVAATGDLGVPGTGYPAYSPNVLAVGGTSLFLDGAGNWLDEQGWSFSGGGISLVEREPAYQLGVQATGMRTIPDVAYNADPNTGFWVYDTGSRGWIVEGGTSAGAPQWAAMIALADQVRNVEIGAGSLDGSTQTLPAIYSPLMAGDYTDITVGFNWFIIPYTNPPIIAGVGSFCQPGYDLVTGLGSPWAPWVVNDLAGAPGPSPGPGGAAKGDIHAIPSEAAVSSLAFNPVQAVPIALKAVDTVFAESSTPLDVISKPDALPLETVVTDRPTNREVRITPRASLSHFRAASVHERDLASLAGLGLEDL
jgi:subtilase family serine protease